MTNSTYLNRQEFEDIFKKHLKSSVYSISIKTLFGDRLTRKINYHPYYQRNYVWDNSKATFFIESVLLGTDIPPLIFFNTGKSIEVIDGRQRYETIKRFKNGDLKLKLGGLNKLTQLQKHTFSMLDDDIKEIFEDAKIRIFEFEVINEPRLDTRLEDQIKKEIFRRYNSGITPLNSAEIDNATYDDDDITNLLKDTLEKNSDLKEKLILKFVKKGKRESKSIDADTLQFLRKYLVLSSFPINTYARGANRSEILDLLYNVKTNNTENAQELCSELLFKIDKTLQLIAQVFRDTQEENRLVNECLLWAVSILVDEDINIGILFEDDNIEKLRDYFDKHANKFFLEKSHHYVAIVTRYKTTIEILNRLTRFDFSNYLKDDTFKDSVKEMRQTEKEAKLKLEELSSLRVQKPEPSLIPVEEMVNELDSNRYLIRPSYQRQEKINVNKASAIIESILLGINLPPIFIFKNENGVREVIDGQQRLLSIIGFLGKKYQDEQGRHISPKNFLYKLKRLRILKEYNKKTYNDLEFGEQDKILDFKLSVIEIDFSLNKNFEPVDLFIRLNNKPYPIKENSFEMWNSFADRDIILKIKQITDEFIDWFFIKQRGESNSSSDRMLNEEMITLLTYLHLSSLNDDKSELGFYLRDSKVNCRIKEKKAVSSTLDKVSNDIELKEQFQSSLECIQNYIKTVEDKLDSKDKKNSFNILIGKENQKTGKRYLVDFYLLFQILQRIELQELALVSFEELKTMLSKVQDEISNPNELAGVASYEEHFKNIFNVLTSKYQ